jgi:hypothetical protein
MREILPVPQVAEDQRWDQSRPDRPSPAHEQVITDG